MLRAPSNRRKGKGQHRLNLIPILDAVFIFIFFLLFSASFIKIYEVGSNVPLVSTAQPPKNPKKPLALTLKITDSELTLYRGVPSSRIKSFGKIDESEYDLESLHNYLVELKAKHKKEKTIVIEPIFDVTYEQIVKIMDAVRMFRNTDPKITIQQDGIDVFVEELFNDIIFGNIQS